MDKSQQWDLALSLLELAFSIRKTSAVLLHRVHIFILYYHLEQSE